MRISSLFLVVPAVFSWSCGGSTPPPKAADPPPKAAEPAPEQGKKEAPTSEAKEDGPAGFPTECASNDNGVCAMPKPFLKRLCSGTFLNVALVLFGKNAPWTHGYLRGKTQAWNAEGGASQNDWLDFDEEVVLLAARMAPKGGMQVSGAGGGYQAIRWNGSCVTLSSEEVTLSTPPRPKHPRIEWRYVDDDMRDALRKDSKVDAAAVAVKKECHGVAVGDVTKKCEQADGKLVDEIVRFVREDGTLPTPAKLP